MATLANPTANATTIPVRTASWSPLKIGVVWAAATTGSGLAGMLLTLLLQGIFMPGWRAGDHLFGIFVWLFQLVVGGFLVFSLLGWAQSRVLARLCGTDGGPHRDKIGWVFATLGGALLGPVMALLMVSSGGRWSV